MLSQISLERSLLETAEDAGTSWDRWQQAIREWEQREAEYRLRIEYRDRAGRLYREKQAIRLDVATAEVNVLQADADRWTAWYNLQLAGSTSSARPSYYWTISRRRGSSPCRMSMTCPRAGPAPRVLPPDRPCRSARSIRSRGG